MTFKGAIRWGLRPKRIGILLAKLVLACTTELAAQTGYDHVPCNETLPVPVCLEAQRSLPEMLQQTAAQCELEEIATSLR